MINGDISNETSPRIIVHIDVVVESEMVESKKFLRTTTERQVSKLNRQALSELWRLADRFGLSVELAAYEEDGWTEDLLNAVMVRLDRRGANPFNYAELYTNVWEFIDDLPYRQNFKGIVDTRERVAMYGSYGLELQNL